MERSFFCRLWLESREFKEFKEFREFREDKEDRERHSGGVVLFNVRSG